MSEYQEVETIIGKKVSQGKVLYCVKWKHMGVLNSTWESVDSFANIKKLKAMSKMLDVRCKRIRKKRARERKEKSRETKRLSIGRTRRKKISLKRLDKNGMIRLISSEESQKEKEESVDCVFQDEYVVDIGSEVFKQNRRLKNCWEERLAREKEKRMDSSGKKVHQEESSDQIIIVNPKHQKETEKFFSNKNVLYNFNDPLNPTQQGSFSQDTSLICKRHSNQAVETLGLCNLKKKHDRMLMKEKLKQSIGNRSGEAQRGGQENNTNINAVISID